MPRGRFKGLDADERDYRLGRADVGFRMRVRATASNTEGSRTVASNPTAVVAGPPVSTAQPFPRGSMVVGGAGDKTINRQITQQKGQ